VSGEGEKKPPPGVGGERFKTQGGFLKRRRRERKTGCSKSNRKKRAGQAGKRKNDLGGPKRWGRTGTEKKKSKTPVEREVQDVTMKKKKTEKHNVGGRERRKEKLRNSKTQLKKKGELN